MYQLQQPPPKQATKTNHNWVFVMTNPEVCSTFFSIINYLITQICKLTSIRSLTAFIFPYRAASCKAVPWWVCLLISMFASMSNLQKENRNYVSKARKGCSGKVIITICHQCIIATVTCKDLILPRLLNSQTMKQLKLVLMTRIAILFA